MVPRRLLSLALVVGGALACAATPPAEEPRPTPGPKVSAAPSAPPAAPVAKEDLATFLRAQPSLRPYVETAGKYRLQVYLGIPDLAEGKWKTRESFRLDAEYFYPASTIKLALAVGALEKLTELKKHAPVDARTPLTLDPKGLGKKKAAAALPVGSIVGAMDRALIFSDNAAADVLYDFVGVDELHERMWRLGLDSIRVRHRLNVGGMIGASRTPALLLTPPGGDPVSIPARVATTDLGLEEDAFVGGAPATRFRPEIEPTSFAKKNRISARDLQDLLVSIVRPDLHTPRSTMGDEERALLTRALETRPSERVGNTALDGIHKTLLPGIERVVPGSDLLVASKSGRAYGFVVENAWVVRMSDSRSFFLTVVIYANASGRLNDDSYQYESVAYPILADLGEAVATRVFGPKTR